MFQIVERSPIANEWLVIADGECYAVPANSAGWGKRRQLPAQAAAGRGLVPAGRWEYQALRLLGAPVPAEMLKRS